MSAVHARRTTVATLLGRPVLRKDGSSAGRIAEFLFRGLQSTTHVYALVLTRNGRFRGSEAVTVRTEHLHLQADASMLVAEDYTPEPLVEDATSVLLERDVLDQQIIDVHGHKVVRVNDVDLVWECEDGRACDLRIAEVEVGMRGAMRRLLHGLPPAAVESVAHRFMPRVIPWEFVDLIDRDPARRVRLTVEQDRLSKMHPSDIADILEDLAPAERDAIFKSLDEEVAAEALEEIEPKLQRSLLEHMESSRVADIVEEMDPAAAADLLSELPEERSDAILRQMEPEERQDVEELLEFAEDVAAGMMTSDLVALPEGSTVASAVQALRDFEGDVETVTEIFITNAHGGLCGVVNLARLLLASADTPLREVQEERIHCCRVDMTAKQIAEQFDKYNLRSLAVVDEQGKLEGVIYAEHVIALLREER
ncbi:magnesium transporter MgtE N-terminal domain-containing protein [Terriglobus aquaticus]|uniref:Magnesium transporter MgtE N-terminal domain-containing protein n=1 Tax=Terriglobus aquaticus TaxID=940139 RepID=A0ABW9KLT7_9BACT|nr:CBS domain-containing protein [Terriglobus aquaticus]